MKLSNPPPPKDLKPSGFIAIVEFGFWLDDTLLSKERRFVTVDATIRFLSQVIHFRKNAEIENCPVMVGQDQSVHLHFEHSLY